MGRNLCNPPDHYSIIDNVMAILSGKQLIYILGGDPGRFIANRFPEHPDYAFVVDWIVSDRTELVWLRLIDTGQLYKHAGIIEQTALFDTYKEAKAAAEEFDRRAGVGNTIPLKFEVGSMPPPKGGQRSRRGK